MLCSVLRAVLLLAIAASCSGRNTTPSPAPQTPAGTAQAPAPADSLRDLRDVLKLIDSKYSFDVLNSVQLGHETHLTLRSFVAHVFYSLRKLGFAEYPQLQDLELSYEESGLYDCEGFEIAPGTTARVTVSKKGWALMSKDRVTPIRRAQVKLQR